MTYVIAWKKYRRHLMLWLTVACINVVALLLCTLDSVHSVLGDFVVYIMMLPPILIAAYGLLVGAILFARNEQDATPTDATESEKGLTRAWMKKLAIGLLLCFSQLCAVSIIMVVSTAVQWLILNAIGDVNARYALPNALSFHRGLNFTALILTAPALLMGILYSALFRSVPIAIILGGGSTAIAIILAWVTLTNFLVLPGYVIYASSIVMPLACSWWAFTHWESHDFA